MNNFADAPDYFAPKTLCETRLVIDPSSIVCEISDQKFRLPDEGNDFVVNSVVMFRAINSKLFVSGCSYTDRYSIAKNSSSSGAKDMATNAFVLLDCVCFSSSMRSQPSGVMI